MTITLAKLRKVGRMRALFAGISWLLLGATLSASAIAANFDADGRADILWRNAVSGQNAIWFMNGATIASAVYTNAVTDTNWHIVGVADFNGDGRADILWRHSVSGQNAIWLMNGATLTSGVLTNTVPDLAWGIVGVGDFNGDGKADILWRHAVSGQNAIWFMNGATITSAVYTDAVTDTNWHIVGVADFNGDGRADILWRHSVSGQNAIWLMNGATLTSGVLTNTVPDLAWDIVGVGDFNGDGKADILWRHAVSGQNAIWLMNGGTVTSGLYTITLTDMGWQVAGVADFNLDGRADILWRHKVSGQNAIWFMNGATVSGGQYTTSVTDSNWFVAPPDTTPNTFSFTSQTGVPLSSTLTSNTVTIGGINAPAPISLNGGGTYSVNGGSYTSSPGLIQNGNSVSVRVTSSSNFNTQTCSTLVVGGVSEQFCVTTLAGSGSDTTPNPFSFTPQTGVPLSTVVTSNTITPTGYNAAAPISVSGGSYSINGGAFVTSTGSISPGQTVAVRVTSSSSPGAQLCSTLTIGGVSGQFCATTLAQVTVTFFPTADNLVMVNSLDPTTENSVFASGELRVGCNWAYNAFLGIQDFVCAASLAKFDVATLAGKTIDSATLKLTTQFVGVGFLPRAWNIRALFTPWSGSTVTWNIAANLLLYPAPNITLNPPTFAGQTYEIDLRATVQAWANGSAANNGLIFGSNDLTFPPPAISFDIFAFYSNETAATVSSRPALTVTYH